MGVSSYLPVVSFTSWMIRGLRVTIPVPRGRKSLLQRKKRFGEGHARTTTQRDPQLPCIVRQTCIFGPEHVNTTAVPFKSVQRTKTQWVSVLFNQVQLKVKTLKAVTSLTYILKMVIMALGLGLEMDRTPMNRIKQILTLPIKAIVRKFVWLHPPPIAHHKNSWFTPAKRAAKTQSIKKVAAQTEEDNSVPC